MKIDEHYYIVYDVEIYKYFSLLNKINNNNVNVII